MKNAQADVAKLSVDIKKIDTVAGQGEEAVKKFNAYRGSIRAGLGSMIEKVKDDEVKKDLTLIDKALSDNNATLAPNGLEVVFKLPAGNDGAPIDFQKAFTDQGVTNTADFGIDPATRIVGNPDALMAGIQQLLKKVGAKVEADAAKKKV